MAGTGAYEGLQPVSLWKHFAALNAIPRPSGHEAAARAYVQQVAEAAGAAWRTDNAGNIVVVLAARGSATESPTVAVQAHLDMVCEKRPDVEHNFFTDPIRPRREGDRIVATGTTLGADNGMGAATALALLTEPDLQHGPLELLFTVEEETGLYGAMGLDGTLLSATMLINLDSEDPDELTIGCAGGAGTELCLALNWEAAPTDWLPYKLRIGGLKGGHSGVQIHEPLANAIKLLTGVLQALQAHTDQHGAPIYRLLAIAGGSAHNAIPRDASANLLISPDAVSTVQASIEATSTELKVQWYNDEPELKATFEPVINEQDVQVFTPDSTSKALALLQQLPHGIIAMSETFPGKVQTSTNLCVVETSADGVTIATSSRSFIDTDLQQLQDRIARIGREAGARIEVHDGYPGWEPKAHSQLLKRAGDAYEEVYEKPARVEVVHAGLECGVILSKKPNMEAISFGPRIHGAHSPDECVYISTVEPTWRLLTTLLRHLA